MRILGICEWAGDVEEAMQHVKFDHIKHEELSSGI